MLRASARSAGTYTMLAKLPYSPLRREAQKCCSLSRVPMPRLMQSVGRPGRTSTAFRWVSCGAHRGVRVSHVGPPQWSLTGLSPPEKAGRPCGLAMYTGNGAPNSIIRGQLDTRHTMQPQQSRPGGHIARQSMKRTGTGSQPCPTADTSLFASLPSPYCPSGRRGIKWPGSAGDCDDSIPVIHDQKMRLPSHPISPSSAAHGSRYWMPSHVRRHPWQLMLCAVPISWVKGSA